MKILGFEITRAKELKADPPPYPNLRWQGMGFTLWSGEDPKNFVEKGYVGNSIVYSIVSTISRKFAAVPWYLYKQRKSGVVKHYKAITSAYSENNRLDVLRLKNTGFDEVTDSPVLDLFEHPNRNQSGVEFMEQLMAMKLITGAAPVFLNMGATGGKLVAMNVMPSQFIKLWPDESLEYISKVAYTITGSDYMIPLEQFLYWKYHNPLFSNDGSHLYGLSPLRAALLNLQADNYGVEATANLFKNRGASGVFVPADNPVGSGVQADQLRKDLDELITTVENRGKAPYINKQLNWITFGMNAQELQLLEARRLSKEDFANVYNYPIVLLNAERSTDNNMTHMVKYVLTNTIYNELVSWRDHLNSVILPKVLGAQASQYYMDFDISEMPEMAQDTNQVVGYLKDAWWLTVDEKRVAMKYDELGDEYTGKIYMPSSLTPIDMANDGPDIIDPSIGYSDGADEPNEEGD